MVDVDGAGEGAGGELAGGDGGEHLTDWGHHVLPGGTNTVATQPDLFLNLLSLVTGR